MAIIEQGITYLPVTVDKPSLFILGLPRSGTTLIYQYIVHRLKVAYFTNGVGKFSNSPCLITLYQKMISEEYQSDFISYYGKVNGTNAPREAGGFWGRYFGFDKYFSTEDLESKNIETLRKTIAIIQKIFGDVPFVNKNVKHLLRINALSKIFPNSYFLIVERDIEDVAISILRSRRKLCNNIQEWWSIKPDSYEEIKNLPVIEQIVNQIFSLKKRLSNDLLLINSDQILFVDYHDFCGNPEKLIGTVKKKLNINCYRSPPICKNKFTEIKHSPKNVEENNLITLIRDESIRSIL